MPIKNKSRLIVSCLFWHVSSQVFQQAHVHQFKALQAPLGFFLPLYFFSTLPDFAAINF